MAKKWTTTQDFIQYGKVGNAATDTIVETEGFYSVGDGGGAQWKYVSGGNTPSQSPSDLATGELHDANGGKWQLVIKKDDLFVRSLGVVGDFATPDTDSLQAAINYALEKEARLCTGYGGFLVTAALQVTGGLHIYSPDWEAYKERDDSGPENTRGKGGYFYRDAYLGRLFNLNTRGSVTFENVAFDENQPLPDGVGPYVPTQYDWNIFSGRTQCVKIRNVYMRKAYKGIRVDNSNGGSDKLWVDGLYGQNLGVFVDIDFQADVNKIDHIHTWPFWSLSEDVIDYTRENSVTVLSGRNDNPLWSNIFTIAQKYAIEFKNSETSPMGTVSNKVHLSNSDFDVGQVGIYIPVGVDGVTLQVSNVTTQGSLTDIVGSRGLEILGDNCRVDLSNFKTTKTNAEGIRIAGSGNIVKAENLEIEAWGGNGTSAGIAVDSGNTLSLGNNFTFLPDGSSSQQRWSIGATSIVRSSGSDAAQISKDSDQTITPGTTQDVTFEVNDIDNDNANIDLVGNSIAPLVPGNYRVKASILFNSSEAGSLHVVRLFLGGAQIANSTKRGVDSNPFSMDVEKIVYSNGSGALGFSVRAQQNTSGNVDISSDANATFLEISRVG